MTDTDPARSEDSSPGSAGVAIPCEDEIGAAGAEEHVTESPAPAQRLTPDGRLTKGRLAGLSMNAAIWTLCWPILIESYLNWFVGAFDTIVANREAVASADAVGPGAYFAWFIGLVGQALGVGATAVVSRSVGKGRLAVAGAAVGQTVLLAVRLGAACGLLLALVSRPLGTLVGLTGMTLDAFTQYMQILAAGVPASALLFAGIACVRGAGDSKSPLVAMATVNVVNILATWLLSGVDVWGFSSPLPLDLGITGIGLGSVLGHVVGAAIVVTLLVRGTPGIRLRPRRLRPHWKTMGRILAVGLPNFFESAGMWLGNFFIVIMVGAIALAQGEGTFAAHIIGIRIEAISFLPGFAIGTAIATLVGQYLGAGSPRLARTAILRAVGMGVLLMGVMGALFVAFPRPIARIFTPEPAVIEMVRPLLILCGLIQVPFAVALVIRSALRGAGDVKAVMLLTWVTTYAVRLPLAYLITGVDIKLPEALGGFTLVNPSPIETGLTGLTALWLALCIELTLRGVFFAGRYLHGGWTRKRV